MSIVVQRNVRQLTCAILKSHIVPYLRDRQLAAQKRIGKMLIGGDSDFT